MTTRAHARRALRLIADGELDTTGCDHDWHRLHPTARYWCGFDDGPLWQCWRGCGSSTRDLEVVVGPERAAHINAARDLALAGATARAADLTAARRLEAGQ